MIRLPCDEEDCRPIRISEAQPTLEIDGVGRQRRVAACASASVLISFEFEPPRVSMYLVPWLPGSTYCVINAREPWRSRSSVGGSWPWLAGSNLARFDHTQLSSLARRRRLFPS